jgi:protein-S-isoprenylcysteine O-methyltransferase Ste14
MDYFDIFQIAELAFFLIVLLGRSLLLWRKRGINPFSIGAGKRGLPRLLELILIPWLVAWMLEILSSAVHLPFQPIPAAWNPLLLDSLPLKMVGVLMILFGDFVFVWALLSFGNSWRIGIDESHAGELVTEGVFVLTRNPIFVFIDIYFIGTFLVSGTLIFLLFAAVTTIGMHFQILQEEKFLFGKYGQAYQDYRSRTGRYFSLKGKQSGTAPEKPKSDERKDWLPVK